MDLKKIANGMEPLINVLNFLGNILRWIHFYNHLTVNVHKLREKNDRLQKRWDDLNHWVEEEECRTGRCRKKQVDHWLNSAKAKCIEVERFLEGTERETYRLWKFINRAWLGHLAERRIQEVDDLYNSGVFEEVLSRVRERVELMTTPMVGEAPKVNIDRIITMLAGNQVTKIGVYGIEGIGKTSLMEHIHNQLLKGNHYARVIMITVKEGHTEYELQGEIANELGVNLEVDGPRRKSLLHHALRRRNFVLILDGLTSYVLEDRIGIPLGDGIGKMIVTSRYFDVCRKTGCQNNIIAMDPLPRDEAFELFKQKVGVELEGRLGDVAKEIVGHCQGVPLVIIEKAAELTGLEDLSIWKRTLNEMLLN